MDSGKDPERTDEIVKHDITDEELTLVSKDIGLKKVELAFKDNIAEVYLNNPPHNYFSKQVLVDLFKIYDHFIELQENSTYVLKGIIIASKNRRVFSSGASLDALGSMKDEDRNREEFAALSHQIKTMVQRYQVPAIAAINGICLGAGLEMALQCHYRVCGKGVYLGFPEISLGFIPGAGGTQYLPRLIGRSKALYMMLSGKFFEAEEGLRMGVVDRVVPRKNVLNAARAIAREICCHDLKATQYLLTAVEEGLDMDFNEGLELEEKLFWELVDDRIKNGGISNSDVGINITGTKKQA